MPNFVIGRAGYDIYLVETAYLDPAVTMIDVTNTGASQAYMIMNSALCSHVEQGWQPLGNQTENA